MAREDWAVIIGIDAYAEPEARLRGAVRDALRFGEWLDHAFQVPSNQVFTALGWAPDSPNPPETNFLSTRSGIRAALRELELRARTSHADPKRLFVFFAGHGVTSRRSGIGEPAILASDFTKHDFDNSITIASMLDFLQGVPIPDQFFFIDGCRNAPMDGMFTPGKIERSKPPAPTGLIVQQFVFNATTSGHKAFEAGAVGEEGGVFSETLLDELAGRGEARAWDGARGSYVVRWSALTTSVRSRVIERVTALRNAGQLGPDEGIQIPRESGERGAADREVDPIVVQIHAEAVPDGTLVISVEPTDAADRAIIRISGSGFDERLLRGPHDTIPIDVHLPPRDYLVFAEAPGWRPTQPWWPARVRIRDELTIEFFDDPDSPETLPDARSGRRSRGAAAGRSASEAIRRARSPDGESRIVIRVDDRLARIELLDSSGRMCVAGLGPELAYDRALPGLYTARLVAPEGEAASREFHVGPSQTETIWLRPTDRPVPTPSLDAVVDAGLSHGGGVETLAVSERIGPMVAAEASTILALAGARAVHGEALDRIGGWGSLLRRFGIEPPPATGVQVLLADERFGPPGVASAIVGVRPCGSDEVDLAVKSLAPPSLAMAQASVELGAGPCEVILGGPGRSPVQLFVDVLWGHVTQIVVHRRANDDVHVLLQTPATENEHVDAGAGADFDPDEVRVLEFAQRWMLRGRFDAVDPGRLAGLRWSAPLATLLSAYLFLRSGRVDETDAMVERLDTMQAFRCDALVLRASRALRGGDQETAEWAFRSALNEGLPSFAGGLRLLADAGSLRGIDEVQQAMLRTSLQRRVGGVLWTTLADDPANEDARASRSRQPEAGLGA